METPNLNYIKQLSEGDLGFENNLISILQREFKEEEKIFYTNFKNKNWLETAKNVHKLKHKISILGLEKSHKMATNFEEDLKKEKTVLYDEFVSILNKMKSFLNNI